MRSTFKKYNFILFGILLIASIIPLLLNEKKEIPVKIRENERFNPSLLYLNSINKITAYIDSVYHSKYGTEFDNEKYVNTVSETLKERFCFGLSDYQISENWIAVICGNLFWSHFSGIVEPNDILKHSNGLCSQQTMVFQELLRNKQIKERSVGLGYKKGPGHFLCEVFYNNTWHIHDISKEPVWENIHAQNKSMEYYLKNPDTLYIAYKAYWNRPLYNKLMEKVEYGKTNDFPAKNMFMFHKITYIFIYLLPTFFLVMFIRGLKKYLSIKKQLKKNSLAFDH